MNARPRKTKHRREFLENWKTHTVLSVYDIYRIFGLPPQRSLDPHTACRQRAVRRLLTQIVSEPAKNKTGFLLRTPVSNTTAEGDDDIHFHYVYRLSELGAAIIHGKASKEQSSGSVEHDETTERAIVQLQQKLNDDLYIIPGDLRRGVNPDKAFGIKTVDWNYYFWETVKKRQDLSRTNFKGMIARITAKYDPYRKSEQCKRDWELFRDFRVLISVPNEELRENFLNRLRKELPCTWVWVATEDAWSKAITGKIWRTPKDSADETYSLLDV